MIGIIRKLSYSEIKVDAKYPNSKGMILVKSKSVMTEQELERLVELDSVAQEGAAGGTTPVILATIGLVKTTMSAGACPTSACTKSC